MSRFEIRGLAPGVFVVVGWDRRGLGFFAEAFRRGQTVSYDATTTSDGTTTISGVLNTLIDAEVIEREDVADAEQWLAMDGDVADIPDEHVGVRVAAEVLVHLRDAAGR